MRNQQAVNVDCVYVFACSILVVKNSPHLKEVLISCVHRLNLMVLHLCGLKHGFAWLSWFCICCLTETKGDFNAMSLMSAS